MSSSVRNIAGNTRSRDGWQLRPVTRDDVDSLHALASKPLVYRYLYDGIAPDKETIANRVARSIAEAVRAGVGMWVLEGASSPYSGWVQLQPDPASTSAELTYVLDPNNWGQGLAARMAWTVIAQAFHSSQIDCVFAGADLANTASMAVMRRLGMGFRQNVQYPLGAGVEYALYRDDVGPSPRPALLHVR